MNGHTCIDADAWTHVDEASMDDDREQQQQRQHPTATQRQPLLTRTLTLTLTHSLTVSDRKPTRMIRHKPSSTG